MSSGLRSKAQPLLFGDRNTCKREFLFWTRYHSFFQNKKEKILRSCGPSLLLPWLRPEVSAQGGFCEWAETVQSDGRGAAAGRAQDKKGGESWCLEGRADGDSHWS